MVKSSAAFPNEGNVLNKIVKISKQNIFLLTFAHAADTWNSRPIWQVIFSFVSKNL